MKFFEMRLMVKLFCGRCGDRGIRNILYVEQDKSRLVVIGCKQCRDAVILIRLFPSPPQFTIITQTQQTQITLDNFLLRERTL